MRPPWLLFVAVALSIYLTLLLANAYKSQAQLRSAAEARLMADSRQVASLITDFLDARRAFAHDLAESHAIDTFLINEALGMSMQYGLGASLYAIEESFREQLTRQKVLGTPVYSDILYFDAEGALIARAESSAPVIQPPLEISDGAKLVVDPDAGRIVAAAPVAYRGNPAGTSLFLVTLLPEFVLYGHITSKGFLYFASITPIVLVLIALWIDRMRRRTCALEADVIESNRDREALQGRNDALVEEIARREALERKVRESEERYRTYVEHAPEGIFVADASGHFIDANPSACAMVEYARSELLAMHVTALAPPGRMNEHRALLARAREIGRQEVEVGLLRKDGAEIVTNLRVIALPGDIVMGYCVVATLCTGGRSGDPQSLGQHRLGVVPWGGCARRFIAEAGRCRALSGQERRPRHGALLQSGYAGCERGTCQDGGGAAPSDRGSGAEGLLPAPGRPRWRGHRCGGPAALAA
jgi:PAS domain S-box-containing protein